MSSRLETPPPAGPPPEASTEQIPRVPGDQGPLPGEAPAGLDSGPRRNLPRRMPGSGGRRQGPPPGQQSSQQLPVPPPGSQTSQPFPVPPQTSQQLPLPPRREGSSGRMAPVRPPMPPPQQQPPPPSDAFPYATDTTVARGKPAPLVPPETDYDEDYPEPGYGARTGTDFDVDEHADYPDERGLEHGLEHADDHYDEDYERDEDYDAPPAETSPGREWLVMAGQLALGVLGGAAVWLAFNWLWVALPAAALVVALAVIVGLVWIVRKIRHAEDLQTTVLAVLVGLVVTVSPAALLLLSTK